MANSCPKNSISPSKDRKRKLKKKMRNWLEDHEWPLKKDVALLEELLKAREKEGGYCNLNWEDEEFWVTLSLKLETRLQQIYGVTSTYAKVDKDAIQARLEKYSKRFLQDRFGFLDKLETNELRTLVHQVLRLYTGPPSSFGSESSSGSSREPSPIDHDAEHQEIVSIGRAQSCELLYFADMLVGIMRELAPHLTDDEILWAETDLVKCKYRIAYISRMVKSQQIVYVRRHAKASLKSCRENHQG